MGGAHAGGPYIGFTLDKGSGSNFRRLSKIKMRNSRAPDCTRYLCYYMRLGSGRPIYNKPQVCEFVVHMASLL